MTGEHDYEDDHDMHGTVRVPEAENAFTGFMRRLAGLVTGVLATCFILAVLAGGAYLYLMSMFDAPGPLDAEHTVNIERGQGLRQIAEMLSTEGVIDNDKVFVLGVLVSQANDKLKAGEYRFAAADSMRDIMDALVSGRSIQYAFTIPEGLTTLQVISRLEADEVLLGDIDQVPAEGSLLPDTYAYTRGTTRQALIDRMSAAQEAIIRELWPGRADNLPVEQPYQALILASIVEKETGVSSERARVAGVFINRLRRGMRLQSDPTIIYGIVGGEGSLGRPITRSDINGATPYNTYQIDGLPPTPIANPGRASIEAVLQPAETNDVFFVADGTGGHAFAETLAGHNANVARWRAIERERREAEQASTQDDEAAADDAVDGDPEAGATADPAADPGDAAQAEASASTEQQPDGDVDQGASQNASQDADTQAPDTADGDTSDPEAAPAEEAVTDQGEAPDVEFPLPEPKPDIPNRQSNRQSPADVRVVPLPASDGN
jgi:UPF0755 protein